MFMFVQTDGNSDYFGETDDNSSNNDKTTITADAAVAATSTVTLTSIETPSTTTSNTTTTSRFINIKHNDFSNYFNNNSYKNQTLSKIFSKPETIIDARSPSSSTSSSSSSSATALNNKPKVLKLPNDYNKSNIIPATTSVATIIPTTGRIDKSGIRNPESLNQTPSNSFLMSNSVGNQVFFNKQQQQNVNVIN